MLVVQIYAYVGLCSEAITRLFEEEARSPLEGHTLSLGGAPPGLNRTLGTIKALQLTSFWACAGTMNTLT